MFIYKLGRKEGRKEAKKQGRKEGRTEGGQWPQNVGTVKA